MRRTLFIGESRGLKIAIAKMGVRFILSAGLTGLLLLGTAFPLMGGGGDRDVTAELQLKGQVVATPITRSAAENSLKAGSPSPDVVLGIPVYHGRLTAESMAQQVVAPISDSGHFLIFLTTDADWLLMFINSSQTGISRFAGQVALPISGSDQTLLLLPATSAKTKKINIGRVYLGGDIAVTDKKIEARDFGMSTRQLAALAKHDDTFLGVKNLVYNYPGAPEGRSYFLRPDFSWAGNYADLPYTDSPGRHYIGYNFQLDSNATEPSLDMICGVNGLPKLRVELFPPAGSVITTASPTIIYDEVRPISNDQAVCTVSADGAVEARDFDFYASDRYGAISYTFGHALRTDPIPGGYWVYKVDGATMAQFEVGMAKPVNQHGIVNGYIPALKLNMDVAGKILGVRVKWFEHVQEEQYQEVTDLSVLSHLITAGLVFENFSGGSRRYESISFLPATDTTILPKHEWWFGHAGPVDEQAEVISFFFHNAIFGHFYKFTRFVYPTAPPATELPIPSQDYDDDIMGVQPYNNCVNGTRHGGIDFVFRWPNDPKEYYLFDTVAPWDGIVTEVIEKDNLGGDRMFSVVIQYNQQVRAQVTFEPDTSDENMLHQQRQQIFVEPMQTVRQGQLIGRLVATIPSPPSGNVHGPLIHWAIHRLSATGELAQDVCPLLYATPPATKQLEEIFGKYGLPICINPAPPECAN